MTALNAERRRLPMVRIERKYVFDGPQGPVTAYGAGRGGRCLVFVLRQRFQLRLRGRAG
ncbi:MAG: DUF899 family protein [Streptosporangiaceae bacterium]